MSFLVVVRLIFSWPCLFCFFVVALGVLGRADLTSLGVDACAALSFAFDYFAGGFGGHYVSRCDNDLGAVLCKEYHYIQHLCGEIRLYLC